MDPNTLRKIAFFICGEGSGPVYRTGTELTMFFERAGLTGYIHDGSTRWRWTYSVLEQLDKSDLEKVIKRLVNPREYSGNREHIQRALTGMNEILEIEGKRVTIQGLTPVIQDAEINYDFASLSPAEPELRPLPAPEFLALGLEPGIGEILKQRWDEAQRCVDSKAFLSAMIMMGSLLEGLLLGVIQNRPREANQASCVPIAMDTGKPKRFHEWSLSEMINVAHSVGWLGLDVKMFSHALRDFRNLVHPYQQLMTKANPDEDTCGISWLVVQAACNDLSKVLKGS